MYYATVQQFIKMLGNLSVLLDKAAVFAETKKCEPANLLNARLAPDQFSFTRQIQIASDNAKMSFSRLSGKEAPKFEDNETTIDQLKTRINNTVDYLKTFKEEDFAASTDVKVQLPFMPGMYVLGEDYLHEFVLPNFYFHCTTAYAILRNNGLDIGKRDFIGSMNMKKLEE